MRILVIFSLVMFCLAAQARPGTGLKMPALWWLEPDVTFLDIGVMKNLPPSYDLRDYIPNGLLPVRNQGNCGSCWAQASVAAAEIHYQLRHPEETGELYSVQELVSSCPNTGGSCSGGYFRALSYVTGINGPGLPTEADHPYKAYNTRCKTNLHKKPRGADWAYVGSRYQRGSSIEQMKTAMIKYGPLVVDVKAFSHKGGSVHTRCSYGGTNHMVLAIAYTDDDSYNGGGYWEIKNSWGPSEGIDGIVKVAYKDSRGRKCANLGRITAVITKPALNLNPVRK